MSFCSLHPAALLLFWVFFSVASPGVTENKAGPDVAAHTDQKNDESVTNHTIIKHSIFLSDLTSKTVKKYVIIDRPTNLKLICDLISDSKNLLINDVTWRHGNEKLSNNLYTYNNTENKWDTFYKFVMKDQSNLGNYTCVFKGTTEVSAEFHFDVPAVKSGDKPLVSYNSDSIVMKCDSSKYNPIEWIWYKTNGSDQVLLNYSLVPPKYEVIQKQANETKLHISDLSENDSGIYLCMAIFKIGEREGRVQLNVLSYMVPLKVFFAIAAEVVILVAVILIYEMQTKKKQTDSGDKKDIEQTENLKSEASDSQENNTTRQRKV